MITAPEFAAECEAIDDVREAAYAALHEAIPRGLTAADIDAMSAAMDAVEERCEALRRKHFPRRHRLIITLGVAMVASKTCRSQVVWQRAR